MPVCFPAVRGAEFPAYGDTARSLKDPKSKKSRRSILAPRELVHDLGLWRLKCPPTSQQIVMARGDGKPLQAGAAQDMLDCFVTFNAGPAVAGSEHATRASRHRDHRKSLRSLHRSEDDGGAGSGVKRVGAR